jgi:hypothetical protein
VFFTLSVQGDYKQDSWGDLVCCQLIGSTAREAVKIEPERMKQKILPC